MDWMTPRLARERYNSPFYQKKIDDVLHCDMDDREASKPINVRNYPTIVHAVCSQIERAHKISKKRTQINSIALGMGILQADERIKEIDNILSAIQKECEDTGDMELYDKVISPNKYHFATHITNRQDNIRVLEFYNAIIFKYCEILGISGGVLVLYALLLGLKDSEVISEGYRKILLKEIDSFNKHIDARKMILENRLF